MVAVIVVTVAVHAANASRFREKTEVHRGRHGPVGKGDNDLCRGAHRIGVVNNPDKPSLRVPIAPYVRADTRSAVVMFLGPVPGK